MEIKRSGSQPSGKGPENYFTGTVRIDPLFDASEPARCSARASRSNRAPTTAMTHIAIVEKLEGESADWMEQVTDEQYKA